MSGERRGRIGGVSGERRAKRTGVRQRIARRRERWASPSGCDNRPGGRSHEATVLRHRSTSCYEVVGVAGDANYQDIRRPAPPIVYLFAPARRSASLSLRPEGQSDGCCRRRAPHHYRSARYGFGAAGDHAGRTGRCGCCTNSWMATLGGFFGPVGRASTACRHRRRCLEPRETAPIAACQRT